MKAEEQDRLHQERLKDKYKVDEDVVVVEKSNTVKFLIKTVTAIIKFIATITIFLLSVVGLLALVFPASRSVLLQQGIHVYHDLIAFLPF